MIRRKTSLSLLICLVVMLFTAGCTLIGKNKDRNVEGIDTVESSNTDSPKDSGGKQQEGTNPAEPASDPDNNSGMQQPVGMLYKNSKLGFQIGFPASWKGKYRIKEYDRGITVYHSSGIEREGVFFSISMFGTEDEWEKRVKAEGEWPYKKLGVKGSVVFVESEPSDAQYDPTITAHKKPSEEFNRLYKDVSTIVKSFKFEK